jgi:hypothetical protein
MSTYSDESLQAELNSGLRGLRRRAEILLSVPEQDRLQIVQDAYGIMNRIPVRPSAALLMAIQNSKVGA